MQTGKSNPSPPTIPTLYVDKMLKFGSHLAGNKILTVITELTKH